MFKLKKKTAVNPEHRAYRGSFWADKWFPIDPTTGKKHYVGPLRSAMTRSQRERDIQESDAMMEYEGLKPARLFGPDADPALFQQVRATNLRRFKQLWRQWLIDNPNTCGPTPY